MVVSLLRVRVELGVGIRINVVGRLARLGV